MVAHQLQGRKEGRKGSTTQILATIAPHDTSDCGRHIGQREQLPDVTSAYQDEEVAREAIAYGTHYGKIPLNLKCQQQDEEAQHHDENPAHGSGEIEGINLVEP